MKLAALLITGCLLFISCEKPIEPTIEYKTGTVIHTAYEHSFWNGPKYTVIIQQTDNTKVISHRSYIWNSVNNGDKVKIKYSNSRIEEITLSKD